VHEGLLIEEIYCGHDAILEFLFGCDADVTQDKRASLEKKPSMRLSQADVVLHGRFGDAEHA
jgi:hypothetical protein